MPLPLSPNHAEDKATDGFYCYSYDACSTSKSMTNPWWQADLQKAYVVSALIVKARDDGSSFSQVEIRFGNSPTISQNPVFGTHPGSTPPAGTFLTFRPPNPMEGRYLSFQALEYAGIFICELQIIEA
ncbi:fucolectin-1-like [Macrobrachium nipponense]|uniref:fucolectin-1-like n=1 Tax=Macrobrachium nipponense TaxID=159736 RepID=UPI0030C87D3A